MYEEVVLTNHTQIATELTLELRYQYQFVSLEEVEFGRKQHGSMEIHRAQPSQAVWEQMAEYRAHHHYNKQGNKGVAEFCRGLKLRIESPSSEPECGNDRISFRVGLRRMASGASA